MDKVTHTPTAEGKRRIFFARVADKIASTAHTIVAGTKAATKKIGKKCKKMMAAATTAYAMGMATTISAFAASSGGGGGGAIQDNVDADAAFVSVIAFFAKWIGRVGLVIAFVGAIQFALGIKSEDAEGKSRGLMVLVAGFIVFAVTKSLNLFGFNTGII